MLVYHMSNLFEICMVWYFVNNLNYVDLTKNVDKIFNRAVDVIFKLCSNCFDLVYC